MSLYVHRSHKDFQGPETQAAAISTFTQPTSSTETVYLPQSCLVDTAGTRRETSAVSEHVLCSLQPTP